LSTLDFCNCSPMTGLSKTRLWILITGLLLTLLIAILAFWRPPFLRTIENRLLDTLVSGIPSNPPEKGPVIVDLDEPSLREFGQWPWPRNLVAVLFQKIEQAGARAIGIDILFAEPGRSNQALPGLFAQELKTHLHESHSLLSHDQLLAKTLQKGSFVIGYKFTFKQTGENPSKSQPLHPLSINQLSVENPENPSAGFFNASMVTAPLPELAEAVASSGFLNAAPDPDGILRRMPLLIHYEGAFHPSLALATFLQAYPVQNVLLKTGPLGPQSLFLDETQVPLDPRGNLLIHFPAARNSLVHISVADILHDRISENVLKDRIILVGTTASGLEHSLNTPIATDVPGIDIHGLVIANLMNGNFLVRPAYMPGVEVLIVLVLGLLVTLLLAFIPLLVGVILTACLGLALGGGSFWVLHTYGLLLSPLSPLILLAGLVPAVTLVKFRSEEKKAQSHNRQASLMQNVMMQSLAALAEIRDNETGEHIQRTQRYLKVLCEELATRPKFRHFLTGDTIDLLFQLAPLHDIGKVGVPDRLLFKKGRLTPEEFEEIKVHTVYGREAILKAEERVGTQADRVLQLAKDIVYCHHEWWDGNGYPQGLKGEKIPLAGRLMAIVDVYDALVSQRIYKQAMSHEEAAQTIAEGNGSQFDPEIVEAFLHCEQRLRPIAKEFAEKGSSGKMNPLPPPGKW
jgi:HD-GYP domain-containing protein (c-di-GMP phosphodiesterase class II)/CHASE2 domain-containing sensor protein